MKALPERFSAYAWAPSTEELARRAGLDPFEIVRFDGNTRTLPHSSARPGTIARALADVNAYAHGGHVALTAAVAEYAGVETENVVLGAGADDLILLCARAFAGPGDRVAIANEPTYPLYATAIRLAGAEVGDADPVLTFCCRPNNPTGELVDLPDARPLVVDEAYFEYAGETAAGLIENGVVVLRTFSKAFGLAGARVGYALASRETAAELNMRQAPLPVSTLSAALAVAALADPPDLSEEIAERERLASGLRALGLEPLPSHANFVFVPLDEPEAVAEALLRSGVVPRILPGGLRITVRDEADDDLLLDALARALDRPAPVAAPGGRRTRLLSATAATRMRVRLALDGTGRVHVSTGADVYDRLLELLASHAELDLILEGVSEVDTFEAAALALGEALDRALGDRRSIARFGEAVVPMEDGLMKAAVDLGGSPLAELRGAPLPELAEDVLRSLAQAGRFAIRVEANGRDRQRVAEAVFTAVGQALHLAVAQSGSEVPPRDRDPR